MFTRNLMCCAFVVAFAGLAATAPAQSPGPRTPAEESAYSAYTQHARVVGFLESVARAAKEVRLQVVGKTTEAKDFPAADLYLCVLTEEGAGSPQALNRKKPTFLLTASQHGNEQSGKEAALQLIRDVALGDLKPLLKQMNILVMPQTNPYGNFVDKRQNEQGLDLNRDHVKLEGAETRAIHAVFAAWMPELTLDVHEKGDDYYRVSTGCVSNINIHPSIERFSRETLLKEVEAAVVGGGSTWHEYLVTEAMDSRSSAGVVDRREPGQRGPMMTRYSTTDLNDGRNGPGIYETVSFIQEGASRHDLPTLKDRTAWQYLGIKSLLQSVARHRDEVLRLVTERRAALLAASTTPVAADVVHLRMEYVRDPAQPELTIKRFDRPQGQAASAAAAGEPTVVTEVIKNWFPKVQSRLSVPRAVGYLVPAAHHDVVETLLQHGIAVQTFTAEALVEAEVYEVTDIVPAKDDYVAPETLTVSKKARRLSAKKGDFYIAGAQPAANLVPSLLEPQSEYGFIRYRAFKLLPEKGSTFAFCRITKAGNLPLSPYRMPAALADGPR
jgi:hypothetical protein